MITKTKIERMIYIIILIWGVLGGYALANGVSITDLSAYFISLTGFIGTYIYSEYKRPSEGTPLFIDGKNSRREIMLYVVIIIWLLLGCFGIYMQKQITEFATYFAALTPFVSSYIIGNTFKKEEISQ
jgi:multisubunit Na+/H+ antiporter MnhF subunit